VWQVLDQGRQVHVQHTLKSMLAEDCVRHAYGHAPRAEHTGEGYSFEFTV